MKPFEASQLKELQDLLNRSRDALQAQLRHGDTAAQPVTLDQQSVGRVSRIDAIQQQQMALASQQQASQRLQQIEAALLRIENGDYGLCLQCAEPIALARLQAQPYAELCLACQSISESG